MRHIVSKIQYGFNIVSTYMDAYNLVSFKKKYVSKLRHKNIATDKEWYVYGTRMLRDFFKNL